MLPLQWVRTQETTLRGSLDFGLLLVNASRSHAEPLNLLFGPQRPAWFELESEPHAELIKVGHRRKIWRLRIPDRTLIAKVFEGPPQPWFWLGCLLHMEPAAREWATMSKATRRGVCVPRPVSVGWNARRRRSVLVSEEVSDARPLSGVWGQVAEADATHRRRVAASLARCVAQAFAQAHQQGFLHRDPHPDNILIQETAEGARAVFVDVRGAKLTRRPVSLRRAAHCLAQLDHYFRRRATRSQRLRFLKCYLALRERPRTPDKETVHRWLAEIARAGLAHARALARQRDRRLQRDGKYFGQLGLAPGLTATVVLKLARRHVFAEPAVPDRSPEEWAGLLQSIVTGDGAAPPALAMEKASPNGLMERLRWTVSGSPARRAFLRCHCLRHRDIPCGLILGYVEHRNGLGLIDRAWTVRPAGAEESVREQGEDKP